MSGLAVARLSWPTLNAQRYDADRLLLELNIKAPPVDVERIARALGVGVHFVNGADWDGAVDSRTDGAADIYVNAGQAHTRQRFTIAHELGHLLLHEPGRAFRDTWSTEGISIAEIQANNFAANLLMPSWMVNAFASSRTIGGLAKLFDVSPEAMGYRLQKLGYRTA